MWDIKKFTSVVIWLKINLKQKGFITELKEEGQPMSIDKDQINESDITNRLLNIITSMGEDEQAELFREA